MTDYLIEHALQNAWCSPRQDLQVIFHVHRITSPYGSLQTAPHLWGNIPLPTNSDNYHVYQIGQINPSLLGLFPQRKVWRRLSSMMKQDKLIAEVYTNKGLQFPRSDCWVVVTEERNLLLAVKVQPKIAPLKTEAVYLRLYSNAYFSSDRADLSTQDIECKSIEVKNVDQALAFQREFKLARQKPGVTNLYINGEFVSDFLPQSLAVGDIVEYVYDSTVKAVIDFEIKDLPTFDSDLDAKRKYLLHYAGAQVGGEGIDYRDDIDVYIVKKQTINSKPGWIGRLFHKNEDDALRQVTHRDYSVPVMYVAAYQQDNPDWTQLQQLTLRLHIRHSGWRRPLVHEHHRIRELYKLNEADRLMAMVGTESSVTVWQARELENSFYPKLMGAQNEEITLGLVEKAYGYNAISQIIADSPLPVENVSGRRQVSLPYGLHNRATMYEYDADGVLLGFVNHTAGPEYTPKFAETALVEGIVGSGAYKLSTVFGRRTVSLDPQANHRFYVAPIVNGVVKQDRWQDVTNVPGYWTRLGTTATWLVDLTQYAVAIKSDRDFLAYDLDITSDNGLLRFSIDGDALYPSGTAHGVMYIPPGKLELWLNGRALIENLDYVVRWPTVVVTNKAYLKPGSTQKITVRGTGFCEVGMEREAPEDVGFVKYGLLSRNNRFNIRDDKVMRIVVGGRVYHRSVLKYSEADSGLRMDNVPNGTPYIIDDVVVPLRGAALTDTYTLRSTSVQIDRMIEGYLTQKLPEPVQSTPDYITEKYAIYSPFASTVMYDLINGVISMAQFQGHYSDRDVRAVLEPYRWLLAFDPTQREIDLDHVAIHPHNLLTETELDIYQYNFLSRAIRIFLNDRVDPTVFVRLKPNWV